MTGAPSVAHPPFLATSRRARSAESWGMPDLTRRRSEDAGEGCWHVYYATFASARIAAAWLWQNESGTYVKFTAAGAERFA